MATVIGILAFLSAIGALGAVWDLLKRRRHRPLVPSEADRKRAQGTLDYYEKVRDSSVQ
jgi:hypothetical protein